MTKDAVIVGKARKEGLVFRMFRFKAEDTSVCTPVRVTPERVSCIVLMLSTPNKKLIHV